MHILRSDTSMKMEGNNVEKGAVENKSSPHSLQTQESSEAPSAVPDGGFLAWLQCFGAFCVYFNTWGLLNTYGMDYKAPSVSHAATRNCT